MNILIVVGIFPPDIGGPATFVPLIGSKLSDRGHNVEVICLSDEINIENEFKFSVHRIKRRQNLIIRWIKTIIKISQLSFKKDLIFVNGLPMESYIANLFLRKPVIRKIVGDWAWERGRNKGLTNDAFDEFQKNKHNLHLEIAKFSRGWTSKKADLVITPSNHLKGVVNGWGAKNENIKVIYNGTEIINEYQEKQKNNINILTVGRLAPFKNIDRIIRALKILNNEKQIFRLYIVGDGPEKKHLEDIVNKFDLNDHVIFTGQLGKQQLSEVYKNSDIYIQASGYEGLPHTLLEAISYNLSIISTPIGGTNEILEDGKNGWVIDLHNGKYPKEEHIVEKVLYILKNLEKNNLKKEAAKSLLRKKFNITENFNEYINVIENFNK
jgi:glycosyltransferase involved in cell wall biosynthesis